MAGLKTLLLEAATAIEKVLENDGTIEQILELVDHIDEFKVQTWKVQDTQTSVPGWIPTHIPNVEFR